mmetsp:Transcript_18328/g.70801  ORF Transcript_18328/g.70801 Transcript_18328/m.70801 type:complete len:202 (+) Transcript_18328:1890-2495(+)
MFSKNISRSRLTRTLRVSGVMTEERSRPQRVTCLNFSLQTTFCGWRLPCTSSEWRLPMALRMRDSKCAASTAERQRRRLRTCSRIWWSSGRNSPPTRGVKARYQQSSAMLRKCPRNSGADLRARAYALPEVWMARKAATSAKASLSCTGCHCLPSTASCPHTKRATCSSRLFHSNFHFCSLRTSIAFPKLKVLLSRDALRM